MATITIESGLASGFNIGYLKPDGTLDSVTNTYSSTIEVKDGCLLFIGHVHSGELTPDTNNCEYLELKPFENSSVVGWSVLPTGNTARFTIV